MQTALYIGAPVVAAVIVLWISLAIYFTGAVRGYRLCRNPRAVHPFTKGYLRKFYADEWPELTPVPDDAKVKRLNDLKANLEWCINVLAVSEYNTAEEIEEADRIRANAERLEKEIADLERAI